MLCYLFSFLLGNWILSHQLEIVIFWEDSLYGMELTCRGEGRRIERRRRCWTTREEEVLIAALKDIISKGWKCENGFRTGYLRVLEGSMLKTFPSTDIRAEPHINSKLHVWKRHYASLASMLGESGITWNDSTKMINAQNDAWNLYVKVNSYFGNHSMFSYPDLCSSLLRALSNGP